MHLHLALIAAAALLVAADETKKDEERIQGTWSVITLVAEGEEYPTEKANMMTVCPSLYDPEGVWLWRLTLSLNPSLAPIWEVRIQ